MNIGKLMAVAVAGDHRLALEWDDGRTAMVNLSEVVGAHKALAPLANPVTFAGVVLASDGWSAEWPKARSGGVDFGAQQLRRWADEQAGQTMPPSAAGWKTTPSRWTAPPKPLASPAGPSLIICQASKRCPKRSCWRPKGLTGGWRLRPVTWQRRAF